MLPLPGITPETWNLETSTTHRTFTVACDPAGEPLALVFKTVADPYVGRISLFKVLSGKIKVDDHLKNTRSGSDERLHSRWRQDFPSAMNTSSAPPNFKR